MIYFSRLLAAAAVVGLTSVAPVDARPAASTPQVGAIFRDCPTCPEMVRLPAGSFLMGSPPDEPHREGDEGPQHRVAVASFAAGRFPITRGEYAAFVKATGYRDTNNCYTLNRDQPLVDASGVAREPMVIQYAATWRAPGFAQTDREPVVCVAWDDAKAYVAWLSRATGQRYRLMTEAEWEYAARAGTTTKFYWGDNDGDTCMYANARDQTIKRAAPSLTDPVACDDHVRFTSAVGRYRPNAFGLYDMLGNAFVWVEDCYHYNYVSAPTDGSAWAEPNCDLRVVRAGSWTSAAAYLRSANRYGNHHTTILNSYLGFRVARDL